MMDLRGMRLRQAEAHGGLCMAVGLVRLLEWLQPTRPKVVGGRDTRYFSV